MPDLVLKLGKGANYDQLPSELSPGVWSSVQNMRFRAGRDERVGGVAAVFTTPTYTPYLLATYDVGTTSVIKRYLLEFGLAKAHVDDGTTRTEVTRGKHGAVSSMSGSGATVTVDTAAAHGLTTGDNVIISGVVPTGYNTTTSGATATVTSATQFTYPNGTSAAVTTQGYWDSDRTEDHTAAAGEEFSSCVLAGIVYVNTWKDGCYYWAGSVAGGAQQRLRRLRGGGSTTGNAAYAYARTVRSYKDYLFLIGGVTNNSATSASLTRVPYTMLWGNAAEPGSIPSTFTAAASNDAGSIQKPRGALVDGLQYGETFYLYQERGIVAVDYIGGNSVFSFRTLEGNDGLLAPNLIVNTPKGQVFVSQNKDVKIHQGGTAQSIAVGRMADWIKSNLDTTYYGRAFLSVNRVKSEVEFHLPTTSNSTCNKVLLWNWDDDTWGERDETNVTCGTSGLLPTTIATEERSLIGTTTPTIGLVDSGTTYFGASYTSTLERTGISPDEGETYSTLHQSVPVINAGSAITATVYHGASPTADGTVTYASGQTYTHNTTHRVGAFANSGRYMAWKMTTTAAESITLRTLKLKYNQDGTD